MNKEVHNIALAMRIEDPASYAFYELYNDLVPLGGYFTGREASFKKLKTHRRYFISPESFYRPL